MRTIAILIFLLSLFSNQAFALDQFQSEKAAQEHCPSDRVVWLNIPTGVFHFKGERWYGRTKSGAYVCMKEAEKEGDRATKNGQ